MQENWCEFRDSFNRHESYVLAVIIKTSGSTYRKVGTMMLIDEAGNYTGLLSGGCLEADICLHANSVFDSGQCKLLTYDLKADADLLWGMGLGCEGTIDILLLSLTPENKHQGIQALLSHLNSGETGYYCLEQESEVYQGSFIEKIDVEKNISCLVIPVIPPFKVTICGAGPDVLPVAKMMTDLGWLIEVLDHRPDFLIKMNQSSINNRQLRAETACRQDFEGSNAVVIMSHHLHRDGLFLSAAMSSSVEYIGLLGPSGRRDKLLRELGLTASDVKGRVFGPIGLDIGGRTPVAIALSICAEIQQQLTEKLAGQKCKPYWIVES